MQPYGAVQLNRIAPLMPASAYKTYGMAMPLRSHWRAATCEEVGCEAYTHGWVSTFDLATDLGQQQAAYCRADKTRSFSVQQAELTLVKFVYPPGNRCFRAGDHKVPVDRPPVLTVRGGDWRGNPTGVPARVHSRPQDWVEDFALHQDRLATAIKEG